MMVKIGDTYFDSKDQPIMVIIDRDPATDNHVTEMHSSEGRKYCEFPQGMSKEEIKEFMEQKN